MPRGAPGGVRVGMGMAAWVAETGPIVLASVLTASCQRALSSAQLAQRGGAESYRTARRARARAWMVVDLPQHLRAADSQLGKSASKSRCLHHTNRSLAKIKKIVELAQVVQK